MFVFAEDCKVETLENGAVRRIKGYLDELMIVELTWPQKGVKVTPHAHPHSQSLYVIKGSFEVDLDGEKKILKAGDCCYMKPNQPHGVVVLEDGSVNLDIFTPKREDFIS